MPTWNCFDGKLCQTFPQLRMKWKAVLFFNRMHVTNSQGSPVFTLLVYVYATGLTSEKTWVILFGCEITRLLSVADAEAKCTCGVKWYLSTYTLWSIQLKRAGRTFPASPIIHDVFSRCVQRICDVSEMHCTQESVCVAWNRRLWGCLYK